MRVTVDFDKCQTCGLCEAAAPEVFSIDDDGYLTAVDGDIPEHLHGAVRTAAETCPTEAVTVMA